MIAGQPQTAPSGRRLLRGPGTAVDRAVRFACEALERRRLFAVTIANNSFENPREQSYQYDPPATNSGHGPPGASWTITGNAGIFLYNGSGFVSPQPPDGAQAAFLQSSYGSVTSTLGNISQSITFPSAGTYSVSFYAIARNTTTSGEKPVLPLVIEIDGTQIGSTVSPTSYTTWTQYTSATFTVSTAASQHTLTFTGVNNASVDEDTYIDDVAINAVANTPTVTTGAAATPSPVNGTSTNLTVAATDPNNEALTYTWSTTGTPPASVSFSSSNGTSTGNSTTASFSAAGTYNFLVTGGASTTSSVAVTVNQTLTSIAVTPTAEQIVEGYTQQFAASGLDQFGTVMATQPTFTWNKSGVGSINSTGLYTAPASTTGTATVTATSSGITSNSAAVTVVAETAPTVATESVERVTGLRCDAQ